MRPRSEGFCKRLYNIRAAHSVIPSETLRWDSMNKIYAEMDDEMLFEGFHRRGEDGAFDELVARHTPPLMRYIGGMLGRDSAYVDDVYQETWIRVINNGDKWHGGNFRAWQMTIAHNAVVDMLRRLKPALSLDAENESGETIGDKMVSGERAPDMVLAGSETADFIAAKVVELPEAQREVFMLRVVDGMSFREIAEMLSIPLNTALGRMHYAVMRLRAELEKDRAEWCKRGEIT